VTVLKEIEHEQVVAPIDGWRQLFDVLVLIQRQDQDTQLSGQWTRSAALLNFFRGVSANQSPGLDILKYGGGSANDGSFTDRDTRAYEGAGGDPGVCLKLDWAMAQGGLGRSAPL
jgi:hypothetical protein